MNELRDQGAATVAATVRAGKAKGHNVAEMAIARVEGRNAALAAIVDFRPGEARTAMDAIDVRRKQDFDGPILGFPHAVRNPASTPNSPSGHAAATPGTSFSPIALGIDDGGGSGRRPVLR